MLNFRAILLILGFFLFLYGFIALALFFTA
ncbi:Protein of unknown function [Bacillus cereus]|uniref:Uncharacterized protein n=1 Tax=Bacillus wiedmannii TaxID=1890302 RepID=A0AB37YTL2_9BACI|nr:Protein of unknown function [Bacillus cereus]SCC44529.1 Protein of unknown function [Bacillus wiedmannii]SCN36960.1 Protein of unknown function [Bacillus wiedmannii]